MEIIAIRSLREIEMEISDLLYFIYKLVLGFVVIFLIGFSFHLDSWQIITVGFILGLLCNPLDHFFT